MNTFKVGDRVRVTPTTKSNWNTQGRMEPSIGMVGVITADFGGSYEVRFLTLDCDTRKERVSWSYLPADISKATTFKGNK